MREEQMEGAHSFTAKFWGERTQKWKPIGRIGEHRSNSRRFLVRRLRAANGRTERGGKYTE